MHQWRLRSTLLVLAKRRVSLGILSAPTPKETSTHKVKIWKYSYRVFGCIQGFCCHRILIGLQKLLKKLAWHVGRLFWQAAAAARRVRERGGRGRAPERERVRAQPLRQPRRAQGGCASRVSGLCSDLQFTGSRSSGFQRMHSGTPSFRAGCWECI